MAAAARLARGPGAGEAGAGADEAHDELEEEDGLRGLGATRLALRTGRWRTVWLLAGAALRAGLAVDCCSRLGWWARGDGGLDLPVCTGETGAGAATRLLLGLCMPIHSSANGRPAGAGAAAGVITAAGSELGCGGPLVVSRSAGGGVPCTGEALRRARLAALCAREALRVEAAAATALATTDLVRDLGADADLDRPTMVGR